MSSQQNIPVAWFHQNWPKPADLRSAILLYDDLKKIWQEQDKNLTLLTQQKIMEMIFAIGGNSPYLSDLILKHNEFFEFLLNSNPQKACEITFNTLLTFSIQETRQSICRILRITKQKIALACAIADIGNLWSLEQITSTLSHLAEMTLRLAVNHLLWQAHRDNKLILPNPENPEDNSGFIILGMGKLGARELNYSSDIDLIILYDPDCYPDNDDLNTIFVRMTRQLVSLMEERDENGYVFRTDLRLRPDPSSSPLAVSLPAAIAYYESLGQTWERTAMSKARPVAGDLNAGYNFLEIIRPFIWRRHLDFAVIDDIHAMKNRIDQYKNTGKQSLSLLTKNTPDNTAREWLLGQNIKLGHGGIREIEFCPQTMQLVWGGRFPELRSSRTIEGLQLLTRKELLSPIQSEQLINAYYLLRKTEHRLQMQLDHQTHSLPQTIKEFEHFSIFMGYATPQNFVHAIFPLMQNVREIFEGLFVTNEPKEQQYILDLPTSELENYLLNHGFPKEAAPILQSWNSSGPRALRTARARTILTIVLPQLLEAFAQQRNPLLILQRFDTLLARHRAGIQLLSLFEKNPYLIKRLASIIGASQFMAEYVANTPAAIDALLEVNITNTKKDYLTKTIQSHLKAAHTVEEALPTLHGLVQSEEFRLSIARLSGQLSVNQAHIARTSIANAIMKNLLDKVTQEHQQKYGIVPNGGICIIVLGKAGSWEMSSGSDLDLMLIFDHPEDIIESTISPSKHPTTKIRSLSTNHYYIRLTQSFISALTNADTAGSLYEVDMRLRPSGSKGPVAVSLSSFKRYHQEEAWTWERMALARARVLGGNAKLRAKVKKAINEALTSAPHGLNNQQILKDTADMRARLIKDAPPSSPWDIKHLTGGLMEVEFIAQALQLTIRDPNIRHQCTRITLKRMEKYGYLSHQDAKILINADHFWRGTQSLLRIFFGKNPPQNLTNELTPMISEIMGRDLLNQQNYIPDIDHIIQQKADIIGQEVRKLFIKLIGPLHNE